MKNLYNEIRKRLEAEGWVFDPRRRSIESPNGHVGLVESDYDSSELRQNQLSTIQHVESLLRTARVDPKRHGVDIITAAHELMVLARTVGEVIRDESQQG